MTSKEIIKKLKDMYEILGWETHKDFEDISILEKDIETLEALKNPMYEEETDDYMLKSQAYWNEYTEELTYDVSMYKWDGTYNEKPLSPISKRTYKFKNWVECFHTGSAKKHLTIKEVLEMIKVVEDNGN